MKKHFSRFALLASRALGNPYSFLAATAVIVTWAFCGPIFHFSDTWQLVINTATTIVTFLSVFLIQNTQNREAAAMQLKLDELIRSIREANNRMIDLEEMSDEEMKELQNRFRELRKKSLKG